MDKNRRRISQASAKHPWDAVAAIAAVGALIVAVVGIVQARGCRRDCTRYKYKSAEALAGTGGRPASDDPPAASTLFRDGRPVGFGSFLFESSQPLRQLEGCLRSGKSAGPHYAPVYIHGPGGAGKSQVLERLHAAAPRAAYLNLTNVREGVEREESQWAKRETDLTIRDVAVSWQARLTPAALDGDFVDFLERMGVRREDVTAGVILDSLDEVHPASAKRILELADEYCQKYPERVVVVAGRGEALRDHLAESSFKTVTEIRVPAVYVGETPLLGWYVAEYLAFKNHAREGADGYLDAAPVGLDSSLLPDIRGLLETRPEVRSFMYPGISANFALENVRYASDQGHSFEKLMFESLVERAQHTHHRPDATRGRAWTLYKDALVQIARRYTPDANGVFLVGSADVVCVVDGTEHEEVNVATVLARSGLIVLNPVNVAQLEVSFWPHSLHDFIAVGNLD